MRIILLQDVKKIGRKHEIKNVSDGYARNFLISRGLARPADQSAIRKAETQKQSAETELVEFKNKLKLMTKEFSEKPLSVMVKTGPHGELFKSVTADEIKNALTESGFKNIEVEMPGAHIKSIGDHQVQVNLGRGVRGSISIIVTPHE